MAFSQLKKTQFVPATINEIWDFISGIPMTWVTEITHVEGMLERSFDGMELTKRNKLLQTAEDFLAILNC